MKTTQPIDAGIFEVVFDGAAVIKRREKHRTLEKRKLQINFATGQIQQN